MKAIFLDRDGTLIENIPYLNDPTLVSIIPGSIDALKELKKRGFLLVVITNQSGIGRGLLTENELKDIHEYLQAKLKKEGVEIDRFYFCPHLPPELNANPCQCRKPKPGLFLNAIRELQIDANKSYTIGDSISDLEAGHQAGTRTIFFVRDSKSIMLPDWALGKIHKWEDVLSLIDDVP